jgi:hypothetical protein
MIFSLQLEVGWEADDASDDAKAKNKHNNHESCGHC